MNPDNMLQSVLCIELLKHGMPCVHELGLILAMHSVGLQQVSFELDMQEQAIITLKTTPMELGMRSELFKSITTALDRTFRAMDGKYKTNPVRLELDERAVRLVMDKPDA